MNNRTSMNVAVDVRLVEQFCQRWKVIELALFGSVLTEHFKVDSDVDVLVTFAADATWSLLDWADMRDELATVFGRDIDLVEKDGLQNPFRRKAILSSAEVVYAAA